MQSHSTTSASSFAPIGALSGSRPDELVSGDMHWRIAPECRQRLLGPDGLRLADWLRHEQARVIKQGPHRVVYRVDLPGLSFYVKHNLLPDARAWMRQLVRPSKARMEYDRALAVARRGVPTIVPLAFGERNVGWRPSESFLITRALEGTVPLDRFLETTFHGLSPARQTRLRQALARELGHLLARVHQGGVLHSDLHCGNILLDLADEDQPILYLIDLHTVRLGPPLGWRASRDNLAMINRWLTLRTNRADRLRFWHAYAPLRGGKWGEAGLCPQPFDLAHHARLVERQTAISTEGFWRHRDRRSLANNRYYRKIRAAGVAGHAVKDLDPAALAELLADPDAPFQRPETVLLKDSRSTTVAELDWPIQGQMRRVIYKRFRVTAWSDPWANLVRRSPALRCWVFGHGMRERGLPTARPLLVMHRRRLGLLGEGYLLTEKISAAPLHDYLRSLRPGRDQNLLRRRIDQLARLVRELHRRNLANRDLKAANILVRTDLPPAEPPFCLIDLVGVTRHRRLRTSRRLRDLARLAVSSLHQPLLTHSDRLRFLRVYLQWGFFGRQGWKGYWRRIESLVHAKVARNARCARPLG